MNTLIIMMQMTSFTGVFKDFYINFFDEMSQLYYLYPPLFSFKSQLSGKTLYALPKATSYDNKERYVKVQFTVSSLSIPIVGVLNLGNTNYPYGMYDVTIYENDGTYNLDPTGLPVVYNGLMNLKAQTNNLAVDYTEYTVNDSENESVYITAVANN